MNELPPQAIHSYTVAPGKPEVRATLAKDINRRFGTHFTGANLFMVGGAAAAITISFKALAEAGDNFIAFAPFFPEYRCFVESTGASLKVVPARTEDFQIDFDAFEKLVDAHTKGVIVNSPNNPSGVVYSEETIKNLAAVLEKKEKEYGHPISSSPMNPTGKSSMGISRCLTFPCTTKIPWCAIPTANLSPCPGNGSGTSWCPMKWQILPKCSAPLPGLPGWNAM